MLVKYIFQKRKRKIQFQARTGKSSNVYEGLKVIP